MKLYRNLLIISAALFFIGCSYDDTEINNRLDKVEQDITELKAMVADINNNISALVTTVDALKNSDQITSVTPLADGSGYEVTFSKSGTIIIYNGKNGLDGEDGKDGTDGSDGQSPQISVKLDIDGTYYWTVNGEWLLDGQGNKIPATAHIATPQIRIKEGNFEISYNEGVTWEVIGNAGASDSIVFKQVIDGEASVIFILSDGTQIEIPKAQQFVINVNTTDVIASPGETVNVSYTVSAADDQTVVDAFGTKGFEVEISATSTSRGKAIVSVPDPITNGKVYLIAVKGDGSTAARILSFEEGQFSVDETAFAVKVPASGGTVQVPVTTNMEYMAMVDPAFGWITLLETRVVRTETLSFIVEANTTEEEREGKVIIMNDLYGRMEYTIVQEGKSNDVPPASGGSADLETFNEGETSGITVGTFTSTSGWSVENTQIIDASGNLSLSGVRPNLRARSATIGTLTSPILDGGCGSLSLSFARYAATSKTGTSFIIDIKDESGNILKSETYENAETVKYVVNDVSYDINVSGLFQVVITAVCFNSTNSDVAFTNISWTGYTE